MMSGQFQDLGVKPCGTRQGIGKGGSDAVRLPKILVLTWLNPTTSLRALRAQAIRTVDLTAYTKFYQASTSELYGKVQETPQSETTPFYPRSPYAVAKQFAYWMCVNYRESYGMFTVNGCAHVHAPPSVLEY